MAKIKNTFVPSKKVAEALEAKAKTASAVIKDSPKFIPKVEPEPEPLPKPKVVSDKELALKSALSFIPESDRQQVLAYVEPYIDMDFPYLGGGMSENTIRIGRLAYDLVELSRVVEEEENPKVVLMVFIHESF